MTHALVVDDEPAIARCFEQVFEDLNCEVTVTASAEDGLQLAQEQSFDVIVLDVRLPGIDGVTALPQFRQLTDAPIVVMTAHGNLSTAVSVVQEGAFEYLPKPFDLDHVTKVLQRALSQAKAIAAEPVISSFVDSEMELVGDSLPMQHLFRQIALAARHSAPVLITGESGTGKELVARAIHQHSPRSSNQLVPVHLASLSEALLERELFGHTAGAYTGADQNQAGMLTQSDGGTLFLDEIGETPASVQVKLLRTIETQEFYPVGSSTPQSSDFRLIAATNRTPEYLRSSDGFRADFYYRLATIHICVPPLREHTDDIPQLAQHFLRQYTGDDTRRFSDEAVRKLQQRPYPGNVRELKNTIIQAAAASPEIEIGPDAVVDVADLSSPAENRGSTSSLRHSARDWARQCLAAELPSPVQKAVEIVESELIAEALKLSGGNRSAAAKRLGIHRETLREKLARIESNDPPTESLG